MVRRIIFLATMTALVLALTAGSALGYSDYIKILSKQTTSAASVEGMYALGCQPCHGWDKIAAPNNTTAVNVFSVRSGLAGLWNGANGSEVASLSSAGMAGETWLNLYQQYGQAFGPHGGYSNTTDRCKVCHDVHAANGDKRLLPQDTVAEICESCHDFTQGISIYGAIKANGGTAKGAHWIQGLNKTIAGGDTLDNDTSASTTTVDAYGVNTTGEYIPGGQLGTADGAGVDPNMWPLTGGTTRYSAASLASGETALTCTDCHTPHGNTSMKPFKGDRVRLGTSILTTVLNVQPSRITVTQFAVPQLSLPALTNVDGVFLYLAPDSPVYGSKDLVSDGTLPAATTGIAANRTSLNGTRVTSSGLALALSLIGAGVLDVKIETTVNSPGPGAARLDTLGASGPYLLLKNAFLSRTASNKLLRDYINGVDMRQAAFGGVAATSGTSIAAASAAVSYDQTPDHQYDPILAGDNAASMNAPWNNGQNGGSAEYGSAFCFSCHLGRLGNTQSGTDGEAVVLDPLVAAVLPTLTDPSAGGTNAMTAINHPTNMRIAYRSIGGLTATSVGFFGHNPNGLADGNGWPRPYATGLALSNAGYTMYPVQTTVDGRVTDVNRQRPDNAVVSAGAPICQQCHEDFRDVETAFDYSDTDKDVPFSTSVNTLIGATGNTIGGAHFVQAGNPLFQNFPHETQALRMLVEGGDSAQIGGGNNDDLCLNCHVPGSTVRILDGKDAGAKDLKGLME